MSDTITLRNKKTGRIVKLRKKTKETTCLVDGGKRQFFFKPEKKERQNEFIQKEKSQNIVISDNIDTIMDKINSKEDIDYIINTLAHDNTDVRNAAAKALNLIFEDKNVDAEKKIKTIKYLSTNEDNIRSSISDLIVRKYNTFFEDLLNELKNPSPEIRWRVAEILGRCGNIAAEYSLKPKQLPL